MSDMTSPRKLALWALRRAVATQASACLKKGASAGDILKVVSYALDEAARANPIRVHFMAGEEERLKMARIQARNERRAIRKAQRRAA